MEALIDNDILLKAVSYGLVDELFTTESRIDLIGVLGAARFVVRNIIQNGSLKGSSQNALDRLDAFLNQARVVEPTQEEQTMASDLEFAAQRSGVALDTGESQLCAMLVTRALRLLCTGDKRAIYAIELLRDIDSRLSEVTGKVKCLEQLVLRVLTRDNVSALRTSVCLEPNVDKALTICFACSSASAELDRICDGLSSYINDLRNRAPNILAA